MTIRGGMRFAFPPYACWDAENRLIGIAYLGQTGKATAFTYDGLGRRVTLSSTPAGGGAAIVTSYIWCGLSLCQARDTTGAAVRGYYSEGEIVAGSPVYYGVDQLGSVRRAFASATSAPAYAFDPYGGPLQTTAPLTDFTYAGMVANADSGLYLATFRAYDPASGRWLSRDPVGEDGGINLYEYVQGNPVRRVDPSGLLLEPIGSPPATDDSAGSGGSGSGSNCGNEDSPSPPAIGAPNLTPDAPYQEAGCIGVCVRALGVVFGYNDWGSSNRERARAGSTATTTDRSPV